ncbi:CAF17-like 4Fe-4S cluster assembly/insertion protein YgfZ [Leucobacter sp. GX24907]
MTNPVVSDLLPSNPLLALPGAVESGDLGVAAHYGSPLSEQRALDGGEAIVDLSHRGIVTVSGEDRLNWLHSMTSQQLVGLRAGESTETLLLDANGRIEHAIRVVDDGARTWLLVDEGSAAGLAEFLNRMRFALRVEVHDVSAEYAAVLALGDGSALAALQALGPAVVWEDHWSTVAPGGHQYARDPHAGAEWKAAQLVFPRERLADIAELVTNGSVRAAGLLSLDALEVRAWRPTQHGEVDERGIAHEFDWLRSAVHLTKGCYRGQETVAKVHNLGHPPRRLVLLHLDGSEGQLPEAGALVFRAGEAGGEGSRPVGRITRPALHHEWGGIALALLKRAVAEDAELEVSVDDGGSAIAAAQEVIVPGDAGATREIPRLKRL